MFTSIYSNELLYTHNNFQGQVFLDHFKNLPFFVTDGAKLTLFLFEGTVKILAVGAVTRTKRGIKAFSPRVS